MKKVELEIVALTNSITQMHSYAMLLGEVNSTRRLAIVIGAYEAQAIAIALEKIMPTRPLTHDLFVTFMYSFSIQLTEVLIYKLEEGVFFAKLICQDADGHVLEIDSRSSDAIALAVRADCKIFTYENIIREANLILEEKGDPTTTQASPDRLTGDDPSADTSESNPSEELKHMNLDELKELLQQVLEKEDYILAIQIRDEINKREK